MEADSHVVQGRGYRQRVKVGCQRKYLGSGQHLKERDRTEKKRKRKRESCTFYVRGPTQQNLATFLGNIALGDWNPDREKRVISFKD